MCVCITQRQSLVVVLQMIMLREPYCKEGKMGTQGLVWEDTEWHESFLEAIKEDRKW